MEPLEMIICILGALFHIMHYIHKKPKPKKPQPFLKIKVLYKFIFAFKG